MTRWNQKETIDDPKTVHVWLARINDSATEYAVRALYPAAQDWVEHRTGSPDAKWQTAEAGMQHYVEDDGSVKGLIEPMELPQVVALLIDEC